MRRHFSILFAIAIFTALSLFARPAQAQAVALDSAEVALLLRDSDNAHKVAKASLDAIGCIITAITEEVEWTPQQCAARLEEVLLNYGQEHRLLHPRVIDMLKEKANRVRS